MDLLPLARNCVLALLCLFGSQALAQAPPPGATATLEAVINRTLEDYALSPDNRFKLAAYAEMKGRYAPSFDIFLLNFGGLGHLTVYTDRCLFRTTGGKVFHLDAGDDSARALPAFNAALDEMFEHIILLGNHGADSARCAFVDAHLAPMNVEPFTKMFIRHILVRYGRFDTARQQVAFQTDWLPAETYLETEGTTTLRKPRSRLSMVLEPGQLRGYYLDLGASVFLNRVKRPVAYATGEEYLPNVAAFKVFAQKLFVQNIQYVVEEESKRLQHTSSPNPVVSELVTYDSEIKGENRFVVGKHRKRQISTAGVEPLYGPFQWIPMMLGLLRTQGTNIGDADVICYFVEADYFERLYEQLLPEEKTKVDAFMVKR
jgi:hypothetical protein